MFDEVGFRQVLAEVLERKLRHRSDGFLVFVRDRRLKFSPRMTRKSSLSSERF